MVYLRYRALKSKDLLNSDGYLGGYMESATPLFQTWEEAPAIGRARDCQGATAEYRLGGHTRLESAERTIWLAKTIYPSKRL